MTHLIFIILKIAANIYSDKEKFTTFEDLSRFIVCNILSYLYWEMSVTSDVLQLDYYVVYKLSITDAGTLIEMNGGMCRITDLIT